MEADSSESVFDRWVSNKRIYAIMEQKQKNQENVVEKFYFAPLEGISGYVYRKAYEHYFGGIDKYFIPFIKPESERKAQFQGKERYLTHAQSGNVRGSLRF